MPVPVHSLLPTTGRPPWPRPAGARTTHGRQSTPRYFTFRSHCVIGAGLGEARIAADMLCNQAAEMTSQRHAEPDDLCLASWR